MKRSLTRESEIPGRNERLITLSQAAALFARKKPGRCGSMITAAALPCKQAFAATRPMKSNLTILTTCLALLISVVAAAEEPFRLRVLSYNIHHAEGVDRKLDLERIAGVILSVKPDLVAVQEVDKNVERSQVVDQPAELARLTKLHAVFGANIDLQGGHYGNALLSRFPVAAHKNHLLPRIEASEQRGVLEAEITIPDSMQPLLILATHLDFRADERERLASAKVLNELAEKRPLQPALLAGDLNAIPESKTLEQLATRWTRANDRPLATIPVDEPKKQIDFILYRPVDRWKVIEVQVLDEAVASDHRAIFAVLELLPDKVP
jgi:endonuclease/exonuclease/phosphatase family metal-dependent hydrolase